MNRTKTTMVHLLSLTLATVSWSHTLHGDRPADKWDSQAFPLGNGSLGAMVFGGAEEARIQFTVDSLWTGDENPSGAYIDKEKEVGGGCFGSYQNLGELVFFQEGRPGDGLRVRIPEEDARYTSFKAPQRGETIAESVDGDPHTKWCLEHGNRPIAWQADLGRPQLVTGYTFTSANDVPDRDPGSWEFEGSDDGTAWETIDEHTNVVPMPKRHATARYALDKPVTHRHVRFVFHPRPGVSHLQVAEIGLDGIALGGDAPAPAGYRRQLDIQRAVHTTTWMQDGVTFTREALVSHPDQVLAWRLSADKPGSISGTLSLRGAHPGTEEIVLADRTLILRGALANGLRYQARATIVPIGGRLIEADERLRLDACDEALVLLAADTNYMLDWTAGWMQGDPAEQVGSRLTRAAVQEWKDLRRRHESDHRTLFDRVAIDLGKTAPSVIALPTAQRIRRYRDQAQDLPRPCLDPELEALLFQYGRYLLIAASRPGTLPANLQGIWNNSNKPAWFADYHSNINLQMNYWLAETTNLPELAQPLFAMLSAAVPVYRKYTALHYNDSSGGFVTRMSINPYGGTGWNWNIEGTTWLAQHFWEHYLFSRDRAFLESTAFPWMRDLSRFWLGQLKQRPDGQVVVPDAWSHEHGPHEDGTAHAQQLMWDLFTSTLDAAERLDTEKGLQRRLRNTLDKLYGPKIGSWGQLMEWMEEKPSLEKGNHRHTSHLFAVHPGRQITLSGTPELAEAARVSLTQRGEVGDSRRSWTWAWRTALWARLGQPERAHGCVAGLLAHNTLDNLWTTHPPFQIDGNYGITGGMAEIFLQSHAGEIALLPALPKVWPTGSAQGLRARGDVIVDLAWDEGRLTSATLRSRLAQRLAVRLPGEAEARSVKLEAGKPITIPF